MARQNRAAMAVEKLGVFWELMYREELKRNFAIPHSVLFFPPKVIGEVPVASFE